MNLENVLEIRDLKTYFHTLDGVVRAVDGVDLQIRAGGFFTMLGPSRTRGPARPWGWWAKAAVARV